MSSILTGMISAAARAAELPPCRPDALILVTGSSEKVLQELHDGHCPIHLRDS
jgi:hypothetical protein